jgi:hypothetical protein
VVRLTLSRRVALEGEELEEYLAKQAQHAMEGVAVMEGDGDGETATAMAVDGPLELGPAPGAPPAAGADIAHPEAAVPVRGSSPPASASASTSASAPAGKGLGARLASSAAGVASPGGGGGHTPATRANVAGIGHLTRREADRVEVIAADGRRLEDSMEAAQSGAVLIEGFQLPQVSCAVLCCAHRGVPAAASVLCCARACHVWWAGGGGVPLGNENFFSCIVGGALLNILVSFLCYSSITHHLHTTNTHTHTHTHTHTPRTHRVRATTPSPLKTSGSMPPSMSTASPWTSQP